MWVLSVRTVEGRGVNEPGEDNRRVSENDGQLLSFYQFY